MDHRSRPNQADKGTQRANKRTERGPRIEVRAESEKVQREVAPDVNHIVGPIACR
jgi:hypothetical protein